MAIRQFGGGAGAGTPPIAITVNNTVFNVGINQPETDAHVYSGLAFSNTKRFRLTAYFQDVSNTVNKGFRIQLKDGVNTTSFSDYSTATNWGANGIVRVEFMLTRGNSDTTTNCGTGVYQTAEAIYQAAEVTIAGAGPTWANQTSITLQIKSGAAVNFRLVSSTLEEIRG